MLRLSQHAKLRCKSYFVEEIEIADAISRFEIPNCDCAVLIKERREASGKSKLFAIIRGGTMTTIEDYHRVPRPERFGVKCLVM